MQALVLTSKISKKIVEPGFLLSSTNPPRRCRVLPPSLRGNDVWGEALQEILLDRTTMGRCRVTSWEDLLKGAASLLRFADGTYELLGERGYALVEPLLGWQAAKLWQ